MSNLNLRKVRSAEFYLSQKILALIEAFNVISDELKKAQELLSDLKLSLIKEFSELSN